MDDLQRFLDAQAGTWPDPLEEIRAGRKVSHWMWFVWPQLRGLGRSERARFYGIADGAEARRYLAHPLLGARLVEISEALLHHTDKSAEAILGPVDALKLRSSMTLFESVDSAPSVFARVLDAFHGGDRCEHTRERLGT